TLPDWIYEMLDNGKTHFYAKDSAQREYDDLNLKNYLPVPGAGTVVHFGPLRANEPVFQNSEVILHDIGEQVLCLEFRSKSNAIGEGILRGLQEAVTIAENGDWRGLVIGNEARNFTVV